MVEPQPLLIPGNFVDAMLEHCLRETPRECCGIFGGVSPEVSSIHFLTNTLDSETRYFGDPQDIIRAHVELRERGAEFLAIYHSHPRWQAVPSRTDLELNGYGPLPQIIVSLLQELPDVRAWRLHESSFEELPWQGVEPIGRASYTVGTYTFRP